MTAPGPGGPTAVYLESGKRWVFACALDWPGWCRRGRSEELAQAELTRYAPRYAVAASRAGIDFPADAAAGFRVTERLPSGFGADFGAPSEVPASDSDPAGRDQAARMAELVRAAWEVFDESAAGAPAQLRKGPRGGGRDRDKIIDHVLGADAAYARKLGVRRRQPGAGDAAAIAALRDEVSEVLARPSDGAPLAPGGWPARYAARRFAWHALDHAWEIEDRSSP